MKASIALKNIFRKNKMYFFWFIGIVPFLYFFLDTQDSPGFDWSYFNSLGLMIQTYFKDFKLPLIDLKNCGGYDLAANPQGVTFSPFSLLLFVFNPFLSNVFSLIIMSYISFHYMVKIIKNYESGNIVFLSATVFILAPFFSLHFAEGHIPYRSFYLIPVFYYFLIERPSTNNLHITMILTTLALLDGGMYFIFFFWFYFFIYLLINYKQIDFFLKLINKKTFFITFGLILIILAKVYPVIVMHSGREAVFNNGTFGIIDLLNSMFNIWLTNLSRFGNFPYRAHEYAHYMTLSLIFGLFIVAFKEKRFKKEYLYLFLIFWIYTGLGDWFNPWTILKMIPFVKNAHIQSRYVIFFFFFLVLIISTGKISKKTKWLIFFTAFIELFIQNIYTYNKLWEGNLVSQKNLVYKSFDKVRAYSRHIEKPTIYAKNNLSFSCYEPAQEHFLKKTPNLFLINRNDITMTQEGLSSFRVEASDFLPKKLLMNFKFNAGWKCDNCEVENNNGLLNLISIQDKKKLILTYDPFYFPFILVSYVLGVIVIVVSWRFI